MDKARRSTSRPRTRTTNPSWQDFALGALAVGGLAGVLIAARRLAQKTGTYTPLIVGGVDLSNIDLTQPFQVDFSVPQHALPPVKKHALSRLHTAQTEIGNSFPAWVCATDIDVSRGRFLLWVMPLTDPAQRVLRTVSGR